MKSKSEQIMLLKSKIAQAERNKLYASSRQAEANQQRGIDAMKDELKQLEGNNHE